MQMKISDSVDSSLQRRMEYYSEMKLTTILLLKVQNSSLENFAGVPTPSVFSASTFKLLSSQSKWSFHFRIVYR